MRKLPKVSAAFDNVFTGDSPSQLRSALVIFEPPKPPDGFHSRKLRRAALQSKQRSDPDDGVRERFRDVVKGYAKSKLAARVGAADEIQQRALLIGGGLLPVAAVDVTRQSLESLVKQPNVLAVLPNQEVRLVSPKRMEKAKSSKDELNQRQTWGLGRLKARQLWEKAGTKGNGIKVAVIDTGVHGSHPALRDRVTDFVIISPDGRRLTLPDGQTYDYERHGTHVCGTIAGGVNDEEIAIGVAPEAELAVAQIHFGHRAFLSSVIDALGWALSVQADVINMSIGLSFYDDKIDDLFKILGEQGVAPVVAIGNDSHGSTCCPGNAFHALGVGATREVRGSVEVSHFSGGASIERIGQDRIIKPDLVAPGCGVLSCVTPGADGSEYQLMDGSSMAAPHAAGVVALLMAADPTIEVATLFKVLRETAVHPAGSRVADNRWGHGELNPLAAWNELLRRKESGHAED